MFSAHLPPARLQEVLAPIKALTGEAVLHSGPDGVVITATGPAKNATVTIRLEPTAFTTYNASELTTGIDCTRLTRLLNITTPTTTTLNLHNQHRLHATTGNLTTTHATIDPSLIHTQSLTHPTTQKATITLPANSRPLELARQAATFCNETLTLETTAETLTCHATGDNDSMTVEFTPDDLHTHNTTPTTASYPIDRLTTLINALPHDNRPITLTFAHNTPLRIHTPLANTHATATITIAAHTKKHR